MSRRRSSVSRDKKLVIWEVDGWRCTYCGTTVRDPKKIPGYNPDGKGIVARPPPDMATVDHIVPKCFGGTDTYENLVTACHACNNGIGDMVRHVHPEILKAHREVAAAKGYWRRIRRFDN